MRAHVFLALASSSAAVALPTDQQPLKDTAILNGALKVQEELKKAEIIPTVIDDFLPSLTLSVSWKKDSADLGNTIKPKRLQQEPTITLHDETDPDGLSTSEISYVVTLTDPDAPSREDPEWSEMCHWIAANVSIAQETVSILPMPIFGAEEYERAGSPDDVIEYKPPGPPKKTGKHRYVFLVFAPKNGTTEALHPSKPKDRQHWGIGRREGSEDWALQNELVPVAANFIYSQHKKQ
ncbi:hypothetical protein N0V90_006236 [Kalmusia sp. IMI 367209]|nr:hypothetical protein N0V90_006236 [Kalmusia sp. IMI 367209]